jgi:hypothetical protein
MTERDGGKQIEDLSQHEEVQVIEQKNRIEEFPRRVAAERMQAAVEESLE